VFGLKLLKHIEPPWYRKLEAWLEPLQPLVIVLLLLFVALTLLIAWRAPNWLRTTWLIYLAMP
jgi:hypothetical protein